MSRVARLALPRGDVAIIGVFQQGLSGRPAHANDERQPVAQGVVHRLVVDRLIHDDGTDAGRVLFADAITRDLHLGVIEHFAQRRACRDGEPFGHRHDDDAAIGRRQDTALRDDMSGGQRRGEIDAAVQTIRCHAGGHTSQRGPLREDALHE